MRAKEFIAEELDISTLGDELGRGAEATVYQHQTDPNVVIKVQHMRNKNNGYVKFINAVQQHKDNPFLPRIFNSELIEVPVTGQAPTYKFIVMMEKLHPMPTNNNAKSAHLLPIMLKQMGLSAEDVEHMGVNDFSASTMIWKKFQDPKWRKQIMARSKQPKFVEALAIVEKLIKYHYVDLHFGNFMYRNSSTGPQVVIIDPLVGEKIQHSAPDAQTGVVWDKDKK